MRLLRSRGVAFVTYTTRSNAEFAREAMMNQSLENNEILNVRWATADQKVIALASDDEDEEGEEAPVEMTAEELAALEERQTIEAQLPPEYTTLKRDLNEDGFTQLEARYNKKQKAEEESEPVDHDPAAAESLYEYTQEDLDNYYYEQEQQAYYDQQAYQVQPVEEKKEGIIPENVLSNLKSLSKNVTITAKPAPNAKSTTGLGSLANYGSDSEDED